MMTYQTDFDKKKTLPDGATNFPDFLLRDYGCYLLSLLWLRYGTDGRRFFTKENIRKNYFDFLKRGYLDYDCFVRDPRPIVGYNTVEALRVEKFKKGTCTQALVGRYRLESASEGQKSHFVVLDENLDVLYDPIQGGSKHVKSGKLIDLRVFV